MRGPFHSQICGGHNWTKILDKFVLILPPTSYLLDKEVTLVVQSHIANKGQILGLLDFKGYVLNYLDAS